MKLKIAIMGLHKNNTKCQPRVYYLHDTLIPTSLALIMQRQGLTCNQSSTEVSNSLGGIIYHSATGSL